MGRLPASSGGWEGREGLDELWWGGREEARVGGRIGEEKVVVGKKSDNRMVKEGTKGRERERVREIRLREE